MNHIDFDIVIDSPVFHFDLINADSNSLSVYPCELVLENQSRVIVDPAFVKNLRLEKVKYEIIGPFKRKRDARIVSQTDAIQNRLLNLVTHDLKRLLVVFLRVNFGAALFQSSEVERRRCLGYNILARVSRFNRNRLRHGRLFDCSIARPSSGFPMFRPGDPSPCLFQLSPE